MTDELQRLLALGVRAEVAAVLARPCRAHRRTRARAHRCTDCRYRALQ